ncbi:hypothetical protein BRC78_04210 [Halobacteriales archaeon QH_8_68_33]|nr:MAG: hypothetical protein BRC78_04210 [Halobacteriales archaeon QH_8_68_33]
MPEPAEPEDVELPPYLPDHPVVREDFAQYYNTIMAADQKVGQVIDGLEAEGWLEETVVVLMADHGRPMVRDKQHPYDSGLNVPLVIRWPDAYESPPQYESGTVDERLVGTIDVTATTLSVAGVEPPDEMHGRPFYGDGADDPRDYVFGAVDRIAEVPERRRTVRSKRFRYVRNYMPGTPWLPMNRYLQASRDCSTRCAASSTTGSDGPTTRAGSRSIPRSSSSTGTGRRRRSTSGSRNGARSGASKRVPIGRPTRSADKWREPERRRGPATFRGESAVRSICSSRERFRKQVSPL